MTQGVAQARCCCFVSLSASSHINPDTLPFSSTDHIRNGPSADTTYCLPHEAMKSPLPCPGHARGSQVVVCGLGSAWVPTPIPSLTAGILLQL